MPTFWLGLVLLLVFGQWLHVFPVGGMRDPVLCPSVTSARCLGDLLWHLTLPALTLGLVGAAATARYQRAAMLEVAGQDYVRTARAKGLRERRVLLVHALRNALLPFITLFGLAFPFMLTGAVLVERVFAWPGMGRLSVAAIFQRDYPLVTGAALVASGVVVLGSPVAVVLYAPAEQIDPVHLQNQPPSIRFPLGTDVYSRDVWSRLVYGARLSLGIGTIAMLVAVTVGAGVGAAAGYWRGGIDAVLMRSVDVGLAMPRMFVLLMAVALWERLPLAALGIGNVILLEAGLSYLGLGVPSPLPSWGSIIYDGQPYIATAPWTAGFPGLAIALVVLALNAVGDGLRDALDPRKEAT